MGKACTKKGRSIEREREKETETENVRRKRGLKNKKKIK